MKGAHSYRNRHVALGKLHSTPVAAPETHLLDQEQGLDKCRITDSRSATVLKLWYSVS